MDSALRSRIHDLTLWAREHLTTETRALLEGVYGLSKQGHLGSDTLPAIQADPEVKRTWKQIGQYLADEQKARVPADSACTKLVKEVAFTHLNRLVAFKMLEARKLVRDTIDRHHDANGFKFYLADDDHADDLTRYEAGTEPRDALGEGPRDGAYRHFLLWQYGKMAEEIRVLFDPDTLASRLFPTPVALKTLLDHLNTVELREAWEPGNEETIGWVYQYFNEPDLEIFRGASSPKIPPELVAAKSQQFTPRWIVRFLVENTLGRAWLTMHPDSALVGALDYLVPLTGEVPAMKMKPVRDIGLLDPACGTMHFGLVAFDLFADMYQEELRNAGQPGWPEKPSVTDASDIAASIMERNIHGIDIDLRAVQLAALALYLKAKTFDPRATITANNLACADVLLLNGSQLNDFLKEMAFTRPVYSRVIRALWERLKDAGQLGSLLRLEADVRAIVASERTAAERERSRLPGFQDEAGFADALTGEAAFWDLLDVQIIQAFDAFARNRAERGDDASFFTGEAIKGLKVLDIMFNRYDVVVMNPPYIDNRDYNPGLKNFLDKAYPDTKRNLYSAFLERSLEFLADEGRLGIITPQTFMFISSFEKTRVLLCHQTAIETLIQTGLNTFPDAVVDVAFYVLRREPDPAIRLKSTGTYVRLVKAPTADSKRTGFERAMAHLQAGQDDPTVYHYRQGDFDAIPGSPLVYWITPGLRELFEPMLKLGDVAPPVAGLRTSDNQRFLRHWWETGVDNLQIHCTSSIQANTTDSKWFPYMKGGGFKRWWGNQDFVVNWIMDGAEIRQAIIEAYAYLGRPWVGGGNFYFRRGVTFPNLTSGTFSARLSPRRLYLRCGRFVLIPGGCCLGSCGLELEVCGIRA